MRKLIPPSSLALALLLAAHSADAQQPIGTVAVTDAEVSGVLSISGVNATILNNGTVAAHEHTASVALTRGGKVQVCATSVVHLSQNAAINGGPLLVALDRGALELTLLAGSNDAILTPDMRMQLASPGPLDLRIRVVSNGDTCVDNRGSDAPALMISDTFGESSYIVHPRQHVLFEHGSLKQVVDSETSPCGCPPAEPPVVSVADAGASGGNTAKPGNAVAATTYQHPFPTAVSEGLAPTPPLQPARQTQPALTLAYNSNPPASQGADGTAGASMGVSAGTATAVATPAQPASVAAPAPLRVTEPIIAQAPPLPPPPSDDVAHLIVRFYRWVFHRNS